MVCSDVSEKHAAYLYGELNCHSEVLAGSYTVEIFPLSVPIHCPYQLGPVTLKMEAAIFLVIVGKDKGKAVPVLAMKLCNVSGNKWRRVFKFRAPAVLPSGKGTRYPFNRKFLEPQKLP
jgi:hypothetical protein